MKFSIFFLLFWGLQIFCMKFHKGGEGVFAFLLVNFNGFVFWYFEVLEFSGGWDE
jgi:hypothetical protein